jgi:hypothetical protein
MKVLNELYVRNVKEIFAESTRRFLHTRLDLSAPVTCNRVEQTLSTQLYSARLTRQKERKRLKGYARQYGLWVIATTGSITNVHLYIQFLLVVISSSLINHSR